MRKALRSLALCVPVAVALAAQGQGSGKLRLHTGPSDPHFVLDHAFRMQQREVELLPGAHHFSFWAPTRSIVDTTLMVEPGITKDVFLQLPRSPEYSAYLDEVERDRRTRRLRTILPAALTVGLGIYGYYRSIRYRDAHDALIADEALYRSSSSPAALEQLKTVTIPGHQEAFKDEQAKFIVAASLFGAAALGTAYGFFRNAKRPRPVFEDKEKLKFDGLVWVPTREGGTFGLQLCWR